MSKTTQANDQAQAAPDIAGQALTIDATPAVLRVNYEELQAKIEDHLKQYDIIVSADDVAGAKQLATELNKQAKALDDKRKAAVAQVSAPIREADNQLKALVTMIKDGRARILDQARQYDEQRLVKVRQLLEDERKEQWDARDVRDEFRRASIDDLVKLGSLTKNENLTGAACKEVVTRCRADLGLQERTERRLLELENQSYRAGLTAPLTRAHVEHVLMADDDAYKAGIERIIEAEQQRQEQIEQAARAKDARRERQEQAAAPEPPQPAPEPDTAAPAEPAPDGKTAWLVTCTFRVVVPSRMGSDQVKAGARRAMDKAGITTLTGVTATAETTAQENDHG